MAERRREPPHDLEAERAVLGALMLGPAVGVDVMAEITNVGLDVADFYPPRHQTIFDAIRHVHRGGAVPDVILVADELRRSQQLDQAGGVEELHALQNEVATVSNVAKHAHVVIDVARRRGMILAASDLNRAAETGDEGGIVRACTAITTIGTRIHVNGSRLPERVDWDRLFAREDPDTEWLVEDLWPGTRQLHVFASRKTGKSLVLLWMCACLAAGRDPMTDHALPRVPMTYIDYEMSEADLLERLEDMGFTPADLELLSYYLLPTLPPLDTEAGGTTLLQLLQRDQSVGVVIDTIGRAVEGEENSADTYHAFWHNTGTLLRRAGIALTRLDHEGHEVGRARGTSGKGDDVDIVWRLTRTDDGFRFAKTHARVSWVPDMVDIVQTTDPLRFRRTADSWPAGTAEKAAELDTVGAPLGVSKRQAMALLKAAGVAVGRHNVLLKAIAFRQQQAVRGPTR